MGALCCMKVHYLLISGQLRASMLHCREWLRRHAEQFRAIQKRLLTRFKDKTPVGLANLDTLLDGTYMQVQCYKFTLDCTICINKTCTENITLR